jgi:hypothetical protein
MIFDRSEPRLSYCAVPTGVTCAPFFEESRIEFANATKLDRRSEEKPSDLQSQLNQQPPQMRTPSNHP